ncbi:carboxypeptidase regulatory-like domain-containing protein [Streptomyces canus]|uniref:carboxypeptidase regulatory-like domain-containing protein n=1 Tax=Streptomyces canus TaxID=58343 RepID=UPI0033A8EA77
MGAGGLQQRTEPQTLAAYASAGDGSRGEQAGPSIEGQVRGAKGVGVGGAALTLTSLTGRQLGRTVAGSDGQYALPTPGSGSYVLIAAADGHQPQAATVVVGEEPVTYDVLLAGTSGLAT